MKSKALLITGILLTGAAVGGYFIYRSIQKGKQDKPDGSEADALDQQLLNVINSGGNPSTVTPTTTAQQSYAALPQGSFPLRVGQKSKYAWIIQSYLNCAHNAGLAVDGAWGKKSAAALKKYYGVEVIQNFPHLKQLAYSKGNATTACVLIAYRRFDNAQIIANH